MEIVNVSFAGPGVTGQDLSSKDSRLVVSNFINSTFGANNEYVELCFYNENAGLLEIIYDFTGYEPAVTVDPKNNLYSSIRLNPEADAKANGYQRGVVNLQYNFYRSLFNSSYSSLYWIKEVSVSRTEIRLTSQTLSDQQIKAGFDAYRAYISSKNYYPIFYLNLGQNVLLLANNVAYAEDESGASILVKLYEPLPAEYDLKTELWLVDKAAESVSYNVSIQVESAPLAEENKLRGPNYKINVNNKTGQTTPYYNYADLVLSPVTSSYQKLESWYQDKAISINVDYSDFSNFVHFSSAVKRIENFVSKLQIIESASASISAQYSISSGSSVVISSSVSVEQKLINDTIKNFDIYEYFLYFNSSSWAWPKSTSTQPYALYSVTSSQAQNFLGSTTTVPTSGTASLLFSASYYDDTNKDLFHNSIPQYLLDDPANDPYITFLDMVGQHFDNIWVYYKDVTNRFNATNNPNTGISMDMVADAMRGLGMQLYTNTNVSDNLYYTLFGINEDGSLLPPTGSEVITNYVTSSLTTLPAETLQDEVYKRIYHNLPYLYKTKGTLESIKALVRIYGIPESILTVREYGGNLVSQLPGVIDMNSSDQKVRIITGSIAETYYLQTELSESIDAENSDNIITEDVLVGLSIQSLEISSSLLSPYTTLQYYEGNTRLNNTDLEIGFSPSYAVNNNITGSLPSINLDQLIGSPALQYSSSYTPLVSASNSYFASYTQPNSIWEYMRLLKFYNNSLFKTIKDFVPARANVSTGIIIKSHMLERNKYARHEPSITFNDYSQSIDILDVSADNGGAITGSTAWSGFVVTPLGAASYSSSQNQELYTGQFSGSQIIVTDGLAMEQGDYIGHITGAVETYNYGALYQNVTASVRAQSLIDLDYNSDQLVPVNYGAVTYSLNLINTNFYSAYTNPNNPFAQVQEYNYNLKRSLMPRYEGSETVSALYNTYTAGDQSYGKTAAIDKIKYQYAYLVDIYSSSIYFPGRSNAQIKYIIDNGQNVLDLTKANKNVFDVQNIYRSGESVNISIFDYDESNPYTQKLANDPTLQIYEGGFRYLPILHNLSGSGLPTQNFDFLQTIETTIPAGSGVDPADPQMQASNYTLTWWASEIDSVSSANSKYTLIVSASYNAGAWPTTYATILTVNYNAPQSDGTCATATSTTTINIGQTTGKGSTSVISIGSWPESGNGSGTSTAADGTHWPFGYPINCSLSVVGVAPSGSSVATGESTYYYTSFTSSQVCVYYLTQSNEIVFNSQMSYYYASPGYTFTSTSDSAWASSSLEPVILPFTLEAGDKISFYNSQSLGWNEKFEYTIKSGPRYIGNNSILTGSVMAFELDRPINLALLTSGSGAPSQSISNAQYRACKYIVWKHVPDETNVMLRYDPKDSTLVENGILFPQYIDPPVRENAGNVIKALK